MYSSKCIPQNVFLKMYFQNVSQPDRRGLMLRPDGPLASSKHLAPDCWFTVCPTMLSSNCTVKYSLVFKSARYGIPAVYYQNGIVGYGGLAASRWFIAKMVPPPLTPILGHGHPLHTPQVATGIIETHGGFCFFIHVHRTDNMQHRGNCPNYIW